jgi:hypothetical protein
VDVEEVRRKFGLKPGRSIGRIQHLVI